MLFGQSDLEYMNIRKVVALSFKKGLSKNKLK